MDQDIFQNESRPTSSTGSKRPPIRQFTTIVSLFTAGVIALTGCTSEVSPQTPARQRIKRKPKRVTVQPVVQQTFPYAAMNQRLSESSASWLPNLIEIAKTRLPIGSKGRWAIRNATKTHFRWQTFKSESSPPDKEAHYVRIHGGSNSIDLQARWHPAGDGLGATINYRRSIFKGERSEWFSVSFHRKNAKHRRRDNFPLAIRGTGREWRTSRTVDKVRHEIQFAVPLDPVPNRSRRELFKRIFASAESFRDYQIAQLERLSAKIDKEIDTGKGIKAECLQTHGERKG